MAMDRNNIRPERRVHGSDERWQRTWSHREQLLKVARRRSLNAEDAEDAVHEAMVRAVEASNIDDERLGAWLTTVTMRLSVDRYRQVDHGHHAAVRRPLPAGRPGGAGPSAAGLPGA